MISGDRLVKFTDVDLPEGEAFLTAIVGDVEPDAFDAFVKKPLLAVP